MKVIVDNLNIKQAIEAVRISNANKKILPICLIDKTDEVVVLKTINIGPSFMSPDKFIKRMRILK